VQVGAVLFLCEEVEMAEEFYLDEPCVVSFWVGEMGWLIQRYQARMRYIANHIYPDRKFLMFINPSFHVLVEDFLFASLDLPDWFYDLKLDVDCYEAVPPGSPPASLTPPAVYAQLIQYFREHYNKEKAIEIWPPRQTSFYYNFCEMMWRPYQVESELATDRPIICVFPRKRDRAPNRNVPEYIWRSVVEKLSQTFTVVLSGTPSGSALADMEGDHIINLIKDNSEDKLNKTIACLNRAVCSVSSQSGLTHVSLLSHCNSYIIGHEKTRHAVTENRFGIPTSFRYVYDYRAISADTIIEDIFSFLKAVKEQEANDFNGTLQRDVQQLSREIERLNGN